MTSLLVQLEGGREVARYELGQPRLILGRDVEEADLVIEEMGVSRRHALLERRGGGMVLTDLGSSNGTFLNGQSVSGPVPVEDGDELQLGEIAFVYLEEEAVGVSRRGIGAAVAFLVFAALLGGIITSYGLRSCAAPENDSLREATELADAGVVAWKRGELTKAKRQIKAAYWTLYRGGLLDDVPRAQVWDVGMRRLGEALGGGEDPGAIFEDVIMRLEQAQVAEAGDEGRGQPTCRLDRVPEEELSRCLEAYVLFVLRELRQSDEGVPAWFYLAVGERLRKERGSIAVRLERGEDYVPLMRRTLEQAHMPPLLHYLAMAESGYDPNIGSPAGARGLWQFMKGTGRRYGLKVQGGVDERTDPEKSTRAAAEYLRDLTLEFGGDSLLLALAGYNKGENGVRKSLRKLDDPFSDRSYWTLVEKKLLPEETREYVARIFAQAVAGEGGVPPRGQLESAGF